MATPNGPNGNDGEIVDGALYFISTGQDNVQLFHIETHNVSDEGSVSTATGPSGPIGTQRAPGGWQIALKSRHAKNVEDEVDWEWLRDTDTRFRFEIQKVGGRRKQFFRCRVSSVNDTGDGSGAQSLDITITSPKRKVR